MKKITFLTAFLITCFVALAWADKKTNTVKSEPTPIKVENPILQDKASPAAFEIDWTSINAGGELNLSSSDYKMKVATGQSLIGQSQSTNYKMGMGFWYGIPSGPLCTAKSGDVNGDGAYTLPDIIGEVNLVFKGAPKPTPACRADANADNAISLPDIIKLVNKVFKGGPTPLPIGVCCL